MCPVIRLQNNNTGRDLSGFRRGAIEISALFGCDVTYVDYRRFGTLGGSSNPRRTNCPLNMGPISRNVRNQLPTHATSHPRRAKNSALKPLVNVKDIDSTTLENGTKKASEFARGIKKLVLLPLRESECSACMENGSSRA